MERVGLVVLSIASATALLLSASYGALYLQPLLLEIPGLWMIVTGTALVVLGAFLKCHLRRARTAAHWRSRET